MTGYERGKKVIQSQLKEEIHHLSKTTNDPTDYFLTKLHGFIFIGKTLITVLNTERFSPPNIA